MAETREIIVVMDVSKEAVRIWFEKIQSQARHPQYQGGIKILGPLETER
jgi:hypothetical protein